MSEATHTWTTLPGGARLAVASLPASRCASLSFHIPAGSRDEQTLPEGIAHFVEHMTFKGTAKRNARELNLLIEDAGCLVNACTSEDQTVYDGRGEANALPFLAETMTDMLWNSQFPEAEILLEREVITEEIVQYRESPADHIGDLLAEALWSGHPLGRRISGTAESVASVDRTKLLTFRDQHHFRNDLVIAVAGPFPLDEAAAILAPLLPDLRKPPPAPPPFDPRGRPPGKITEKRDTEQLQLAMAWHSPGRLSEERHALRLLSLMLAESSSSRLFLGLREERGICYQISSDASLFRETGALEIHLGLDPRRRSEALGLILAETADLARSGPRTGELDRAKRVMLSQATMAMESTAAHAAWAGENLLELGRIPSPQQWRDRVQQVTDDEVREIARRIFEGGEPSMAEIMPD
jgi:predicted Zn-dependent peptidase